MAYYKNRYFYNRLDNIDPAYLQNITQSWIQCNYCGRTIMYSQRIKHERTFHEGLNNCFIYDYLDEKK